MTRVTGKLLRNTEVGREYGCVECSNTDHTDDCVILYSVDTEHHIKNKTVIKMTGDDGHLEVIRDLHGAYPYSRKRIVTDGVTR